MKLITRTPLDKVNPIGVQGVRVIDLHRQLTLLIRSRTGSEACAAFFAEPRLGAENREIAWYAGVDGELRPFPAEGENAGAEAALAEIIAAIRDVADRLESDGSREQRLNAAYLRAMLRHARESDMCLVGDQPVLVNWACEPAGVDAASVDLSARLRPMVPVGDDDTTPKQDTDDATALRTAEAVAATGAVASGSRCWLGWIGWLLALIVLLLILWFIQRHYTPSAGGDLNELLDERIALKKGLSGNAQALQEARLACDLRRECPVEMPPEPESSPGLGTERPEFTGEPVKATEYCEPNKVVRPAIAIVMDNSGSMHFPINMPSHLDGWAIQRYNSLKGVGAWADMANIFADVWRPGSSIFDTDDIMSGRDFLEELRREHGGEFKSKAAKRVIANMLLEAPADSTMGLVVFSDCDFIEALHANTPADRAQLAQAVSRLEPNGGTPIAASLQEAVQMVDGGSAEAPAIVVMVTDGEESCNGDPCAMARRIKQAKPYLAVHMVRLGDSRSTQCIADIMGGRVYDSGSAAELASVLEEASITAPFELGCEE